jgi:hypothetical protein
VAATAVISPMLFLGNASGHDFQFHIASWMDAANEWHEGIVYPRWAEWANWGYGEPRFIFYPPGSWMAGAALGQLLPWRVVPGAFIWLALVAAGIAMWNLAREWLAPRFAIVAAVLFAVNPYHLVIVYYRSDFAELMAGAFLPLVVWGAVRVGRGEWRRVPLLAAAFAGIWLSNAPAAVIATYSLALLLCVQCVSRRNLRPILAGGGAMIGGFGLAAFYILPAAREQRWVQIAQILADNLDPARNFLFSHSNDPDFVSFNWKVSYVAISLIAVTLIAAAFVLRKREFTEPLWCLAPLGLASIVLMLPFTNFVWRVLPELRFVQFPWRWLDVLALVSAFFVAAAIGGAQRRWTSWAAAAAVAIALLVGARAMVRTAWWDTGDVASVVASIASGGGYRGTDEYDPLGCDRYNLPGDPDPDERVEGISENPAQRIEKFDELAGRVTPAPDVPINFKMWSANDRVFYAMSFGPTKLAVRLLNYPAWEVRVDGKQVIPEAAPDTGQMLIPVSLGSHYITIWFRPTADREVGAAISIGFVLMFGPLGLAVRKKTPSP